MFVSLVEKLEAKRPSKGLFKRLSQNEKGTAGIEFGGIFAIIMGSTLAVFDLGMAMDAQFDVERKVRLGIEGALRLGAEQELVTAFADNSGSSLFGTGDNLRQNGSSLSINEYYICRDESGEGTRNDDIADVSCSDFETWFTISSTQSVNGFFLSDIDLESKVDIFVE